MRHQEVKMVYSYFPGCTLKTKAKDLDRYGRESAKALGFELEEIENWQCCGGVYPLGCKRKRSGSCYALFSMSSRNQTCK